MVNAKKEVMPATQTASIPKYFRYPKPFARQSLAQDVLSNWRKDPKWVVPTGYADYSTVTPGNDGQFYIEVNICPSLHSNNGNNSYLMAATG